MLRLRELAEMLGLNYQTLLTALCRSELNKYRVGRRLINFCPEFIRELYNFFELRKRSTNFETFPKYEIAQKRLKKIYEIKVSEAI